MSEWQMPQYLMSIATSCSRGSRRSSEYGANGALAVIAAYPLVLLMLSRFREIFQECSSIDAATAAAASWTQGFCNFVMATESWAGRERLGRTRAATRWGCGRRCR